MKLASQYATALVSAWEEAMPKDRSHVIDRFVKLIVADRAQLFVPFIVKAVEREIASRKAQRRVVLEVVHQESATTVARHLKAETKISDEVIGGFRLRRQGEIIDASVKGALQAMHRTLAE